MIGAAVRRQVRSRASNRCEYCQLSQAEAGAAVFHVEHVIPKQHGGPDALGNLALSCFHCNLHKGPNLAGIYPDTGRPALLFNPRTQRWQDHFEARGEWIVGKTPTGRATVRVLAMNADIMTDLRAAR